MPDFFGGPPELGPPPPFKPVSGGGGGGGGKDDFDMSPLPFAKIDELSKMFGELSDDEPTPAAVA